MLSRANRKRQASRSRRRACARRSSVCHRRSTATAPGPCGTATRSCGITWYPLTSKLHCCFLPLFFCNVQARTGRMYSDKGKYYIHDWCLVPVYFLRWNCILRLSSLLFKTEVIQNLRCHDMVKSIRKGRYIQWSMMNATIQLPESASRESNV